MLGIQVEGTHPWGPRVRVEFSGVESHVWFQKWFPEACFLAFGAGTWVRMRDFRNGRNPRGLLGHLLAAVPGAP